MCAQVREERAGFQEQVVQGKVCHSVPGALNHNRILVVANAFVGAHPRAVHHSLHLLLLPQRLLRGRHGQQVQPLPVKHHLFRIKSIVFPHCGRPTPASLSR